jgi:hypothetical protein
MQQKTFSLIDQSVGWLMFAISAVTYALTIEPTASLWDCPEFITCGYKMEIGHPPGAPFFMLTSNLFSQFAGSPADVARMINLLSALLSAGCILFLFWTITHFARQLILLPDRYPWHQVLMVEACGVVGSLAYAFSDTFWFSAVEGEVYAYSSFLTSLLFWLILKWEDEAAEPSADRWLILIAYLIGLSIGVHLLGLLCIPPMVLVAYYKKAAVGTRGGTLRALLFGALLVALVLYGIVPGVVKAAGWFELFFTNVCHLPYHTGLFVYLMLLVAGVVLLVMKTRTRCWHTAALCLAMILIGYSSYAVIFIRSAANPPMDENSPDNVFALSGYLGREQYGDRPLLYGPAYTSEVEREPQGDYLVPKTTRGTAVYQPSPLPGAQRYEEVSRHQRFVYQQNMLFPRMHSREYAAAYEQWMGGVNQHHHLPTQWENLRFFLSYQLNFMYLRYFLWNFVGRQNNIQGHGEVEHGNWITGITPVDNVLLGCDTRQLPSDLRQNKGRNVFYGLPLFLGLMGMVAQCRKGRVGVRQWKVVMLLFFMTGIAIVLYLNQTPLQSRERDYAYAGSFCAFAIWIGLGVAGVASLLRLLRLRPLASALTAAALCLAVPLQMVSQTWDDHDRSGRYTCRDFGANYLQSMQQEGHPIILTNGDNETFPLWYNQEVEGVRTDARVCNLSYAQTDWYIDQMKRPAYDSPPLPISWQRKDYTEGSNEGLTVRPDDSISFRYGDTDMKISMNGRQLLTKSDLLVLEMLSHGDASRPLYTSITLGSSLLPFLKDHLVLEGLAYRVVPEKGSMRVDVERLYDNVMHRFRFGGLNRKDIYVDADVQQMAGSHQMVMAILIDSLMQRGDLERAGKVADRWQHEMPPSNVPYTAQALSMASCYYRLGRTAQADAIVQNLLTRASEWLRWVGTIRAGARGTSPYTVPEWLQTMQEALVVADRYGRENIVKSYFKTFESYVKQFK